MGFQALCRTPPPRESSSKTASRGSIFKVETRAICAPKCGNFTILKLPQLLDARPMIASGPVRSLLSIPILLLCTGFTKRCYREARSKNISIDPYRKTRQKTYARCNLRSRKADPCPSRVGGDWRRHDAVYGKYCRGNHWNQYGVRFRVRGLPCGFEAGAISGSNQEERMADVSR